jgi:CRISPR system Cascade subunit CasB
MTVAVEQAGSQDWRLVAELKRLAEHRETDSGARATLAILRRAVGKPPGEAADAARFVWGFLPRDAPPWQVDEEEEVFHLIAGLFALHPKPWPEADTASRSRNLGASFARLRAAVEQRGGGESVERRLVALLNSHADDLPKHLRQAISLLRSEDIPVDWLQLLRDIRGWDRDDRRVQRRWAQAFWGAAVPTTSEPSTATTAASDDDEEDA